MEETMQNEKRSRIDAVRSFVSCKLRVQINKLNDAFNRRSPESKRVSLMIFGTIAGLGALFLMISPFVSDPGRLPPIEGITKPTDIYQKNPMKHNEAQQLIPVGKMKGEMDGEFEAFYIALDAEGKIYINRDPSFGDDRFVKSSGWVTITNEEFRAYEKQLHFIRFKQKGLTP